MKKEELIAKGLTEEQAKAVMDIYTEEMKGFIPKSRFDEVNTAKADLEKQVADRDKQLKVLKDEPRTARLSRIRSQSWRTLTRLLRRHTRIRSVI